MIKIFISVILNSFQDLILEKTRCRNKFGMTKGTKGFTLIEFLIVIAVLGVVGSIAAGVITFSLRSANKTNTIENVRQSGNYVISQMAKTIQYARVFDGLSDGVAPYTTTCPAAASTPYSHIKVTPFNSTPIIYSCSGGNVVYQKPPVAAVSLIPSSLAVSDCSFTCTVANPTDLPIIRISFGLRPSVASTLVEKFTTPITFETSVTMRNYQR